MKKGAKKITVFFLLFFCWTQWSNAQSQNLTQNIRGTVLDKETQRTIPGANIVISELNKGTTSDLEGVFELSEVPVGRHTIVVSYIGYEPYILSNIILS